MITNNLKIKNKRYEKSHPGEGGLQSPMPVGIGLCTLPTAGTAIELGALFHRARNVIPAVQRVLDSRFTTVDTQRHLLLGRLVGEPDLGVPLDYDLKVPSFWVPFCIRNPIDQIIPYDCL